MGGEAGRRKHAFLLLLLLAPLPSSREAHHSALESTMSYSNAFEAFGGEGGRRRQPLLLVLLRRRGGLTVPYVNPRFLFCAGDSNSNCRPPPSSSRELTMVFEIDHVFVESTRCHLWGGFTTQTPIERRLGRTGEVLRSIA